MPCASDNRVPKPIVSRTNFRSWCVASGLRRISMIRRANGSRSASGNELNLRARSELSNARMAS